MQAATSSRYGRFKARAPTSPSPVGIALDAHANVYVLNAEGSPTRSVTVYAAGAHGNVKPIRDIVGEKTGLYAAPAGIAVDGSGRLYVLQSGTSNSISVFAPGATWERRSDSGYCGRKYGFGESVGDFGALVSTGTSRTC